MRNARTLRGVHNTQDASIEDKLLADLGQKLGVSLNEGSEAEEVASQAWLKYQAGWRPRRNPTQLKAARSPARFKLYYGERGTGKTRGALDEMVEHCFLEEYGLGILVVRYASQAKGGGAWDELWQHQNCVLDTWRNGNMNREGERLDEGIGMEWIPPVYDAQTHIPSIFLKNRFGAWSEINMISLPVTKQVMDKIKGKQPSFVVVDEAQTLADEDYFKFVVQQVGRRRGIRGMQKVIYCANPKGPTHWLYRHFIGTDSLIADEETGQKIPDKNKAVFHIPFQENKHNVPDEYYANLLTAVSNDPIERRRNLKGEWVDRVDGAALFPGFGENFVRGDRALGIGYLPTKDVTCILSYDLGAPNSSISWLQIVWAMSKRYLSYFDESDYVDCGYIPYTVIVPQLIDRMMFWEEMCGGPLRWEHISDDSAFNQWRAKDGSFDAADVEDISRKYVLEKGLPGRFIIKMKAAPKGKGSIAARTRMLRDAIAADELRVSGACNKTIGMFLELPEDPDAPCHPKDERKNIHRFSSATYGPFYYHDRRDERPDASRTVRPSGFRLYR